MMIFFKKNVETGRAPSLHFFALHATRLLHIPARPVSTFFLKNIIIAFCIKKHYFCCNECIFPKGVMELHIFWKVND